jgi:hypothetical protein
MRSDDNFMQSEAAGVRLTSIVLCLWSCRKQCSGSTLFMDSLWRVLYSIPHGRLLGECSVFCRVCIRETLSFSHSASSLQRTVPERVLHLVRRKSLSTLLKEQELLRITKLMGHIASPSLRKILLCIQ